MKQDTAWSSFIKQIVTVALLVGGVLLFFRLRILFGPLIIALLLAYIIHLPLKRVMANTGWSRNTAVLVTELVTVLLVLTVPAAITPWFISSITAFSNSLVKVIQELLTVTPQPISITSSLTIDLGPFYQPINQWLRSTLGPNGDSIANMDALLRPLSSGAAIVLRGAVSGVLWGFFALVIAFYVVRDGPRFARFIGSRVPDKWRGEFGRLWSELVHIWDNFVRGQLLMGLIVGAAVWIIMGILGVRNAAVLGLISGILEFVPTVGPVIAAVPGVAIALFLGSSWLPLPNLWFALIVLFSYIAVQQVENLYLLPRVVGTRVRLHPGVVIVGALAGNALGGILGVLLAVPTIAAGRLILGYVLRKLFDMEPFPPDEPVVDRKVVWGTVVAARRVRAVLFDIDGTLVETDDRAAREIATGLAFADRFLPQPRRIHYARRYLMLSEGPLNRAVTLLDRVGLDDFAFKMRRMLLRSNGGHTVAAEPVPGTIETLSMLKLRGYAVGIVTSRERSEAERLLSEAGLGGMIQVTVAREDTPRMKPHPLPIKAAASRLGIPVEQCVVVGDTAMDVRAAKAAGALAVGVECGFGEGDDFRDADLVLCSTGELAAWL
jgi:HAD superfamily hydrolase (TIGR01509 family)